MKKAPILLLLTLASQIGMTQVTQESCKHYFDYWGSDELTGIYSSIDIPNPNTWFELCVYFDQLANRYRALVIKSRLKDFKNCDTFFVAEKTNRLGSYKGWKKEPNQSNQLVDFEIKNEILTISSANTGPLFFRRKYKGVRSVASFTSYGTGFFINEDHVATNFHVIKDASSIVIDQKLGNDIFQYRAELIAKDSIHDVAIIKIMDSAFVPVKELPYSIGYDKNPQLSEKVWSLGYPQALNFAGRSIKFGNGNISCLLGLEDSPNCFQTSINALPGSSGSPVFNESGSNVYGIMSSYLVWMQGITRVEQTDFTYAVNAEILKSLMSRAGVKPLEVKRTQKSQTDIVKKRESLVVLVKIK